jgi:hypothetical protein
MTRPIPKWLWYAGLVWGILFLALGVAAAATGGASDTTFSVFTFVVLFTLPIVACIAARWIPMIAGLALITCFCWTLTVIWIRFGFKSMETGLTRPVLWPYLLFGIAYLIFAGKRRRTQPQQAA